jgi:hypothetical protein
MHFFVDELVKIELAERARAARRLELARASRVRRPAWQVRVGLRLMALGERLGAVRRVPAAPSAR